MSRKSWPGVHSLHLRLTAWYVLLLGLTLILFSGYLYIRMEQSLLTQVDTGLQVAASQAMTNIDAENNQPEFQNNNVSQAVAQRLSHAGFVVRLVDLKGTVLDGIGDLTSLPPSLPAAPGYSTVGGSGVSWRTYSVQLSGSSGTVRGWLQVGQSLASMQDALARLLHQAFLGIPLIILITGIGGLFLANRALRPIEHITNTAQAISGSDLSRRIGKLEPSDEVARLAATFDSMLDRVQAAFIREERFVADASHE
ncbi:MAG: HAMP domain-containing protein, partial [Anaerolineae bacterium]